MKITINERAEKILERIKTNFDCNDSTAIIIMSKLLRFYEMKVRLK